MNGLRHDAWGVFQEQREKSPNWKWSFNLAVALHAAVFAGAVFLPDAVETPHYDDVIIVDLLSQPASAPPASAPALVAKRVTAVRRSEPEPVQREQSVKEVVELESSTPDVIPEAEPEVDALAVSPPEPEIIPEPIAQVNPISLRPLKRKIKLVADTRLAEVKEQEEQAKSADQKKKRLAEQKKRKEKAEAEKRLGEQKKRRKAAEAEKKLAEQKKRKKAAEAEKKLAEQKKRKKNAEKARRIARQAEQAAEQAQQEAAIARQEYASVSQAASDINTPLASGGAESESGVAGGSGTGHSGGSGAVLANSDVIERQYGATLNDRIRSQWQLPEIITTKSHLKAKVALTVRRDGSIEDMRLEQRSGDAVFDQSVIKALRNAEPMPSFPALIRKSTLEFALNFTPQGLTL